MSQNIQKRTKNFAYRLNQLMGFILGARFFVVGLLTFALYVSTFFLFNREESFKAFVFDYHAHLIILCSILSIMAGGIINQFYDREKDQITKPFRSRIQSFFEQKYFLYAYVILNVLGLGIAWTQSWRVFIFFLVYQFLMWLYSHKLSKILLINNLTFVGLSMYPFFGMLVYYRTFTPKVFFMAIFLFLMLMIIDMTKDLLTKNADRVFGYKTIANQFKSITARRIIILFCLFAFVTSLIIIKGIGLHSIMAFYFAVGLFVLIVTVFWLLRNYRNDKINALTILKFWIFIGILSMLFDGIYSRFSWAI
ncbi:UbiA family prenyltransferase [Chryseobacterium sp. POL2]|uniref:UbiA family prenyltransferase n=1 Tax=Chryseobacterium sp. POL2 TaxID=2713414 RepID=UPI0013E0EB96|nr:UbiA family prenyltransferase [Chryseobacterium sp. POL2]QIG88709.1 UbiA family prenyltransferase [Chryseobacterium sp. POL2]